MNNGKNLNIAENLDQIMPALTMAALFLFTCMWWYPGISSFDSDQQYMQAISGHYSDWYPPIMAWLWSRLRLIQAGNGPMFFLQVFLYWAGFGIIAAALSRLKYIKLSWSILLVALFPSLYVMSLTIQKDIGLAVTFLSAFSIIFWYRSQNIKIPLFALILISVLLFYGMMVRANGVFGGAALIIYLLRPGLIKSPYKICAMLFLVTLIFIPFFNFFNHSILGATRNTPHRSLEIFDVAGIAYNSNDISVFEGEDISLKLVKECYTPLMWDTLGNRGNCQTIWYAKYPHQTAMWLKAIVKHPVAYIEHRLMHYNCELAFMVSRHHNDARIIEKMKFFTPYHLEPQTLAQAALDIVLVNPLTAPVFWVVLGLIVLSVLHREIYSPLDEAAFYLLLSGLIYSLAYLVVGVASDSRYQFWPILSIFTAFLLFLPSHTSHLYAPAKPDYFRALVLSVTLIVTLVSEIICGDALLNTM